MLAGSDVVMLDDAAKFASKHAGTEITPADFLRAAGRGQIPMRAICPRDVTMEPCRGSDKPLTMPENSIPTLPLDACKALSNSGRAEWRTIDGLEKVEAFGGVLGRFTRWQLPDTEPDILTTPNDCRVMGWDVHSLADAFIDKPAPAGETKEKQSHIDDEPEYSGLTDSERKERARAINRATQAQWDRIKNDLADRHYQHTENLHNEWQEKLDPAQPPRVEPHTAPAQTAAPAPVVATSDNPLKSAAPVGRGWVMKKAALIKKHATQWPTANRDFRDASENDLSKAAKAPGHGNWFEADALKWAEKRGKLTKEKQQSPTNSIFNLTGTKHTIEG